MRIIACIKAVPSSTEVKMDPKTNTIVRDGKQAVINPFDATALECALQAREALANQGADVTVTALSMGIPATADLLRDCVARGADSGVLLSDRAFAGGKIFKQLLRSVPESGCHAGARYDDFFSRTVHFSLISRRLQINFR